MSSYLIRFISPEARLEAVKRESGEFKERQDGGPQVI